MPQKSLRMLSLLVSAAFMTPVLADVSNLRYFIIHILIIIPLWSQFNLIALRQKTFWKLFPLAGLLISFVSFQSSNNRESSTFILILFCLIYEYYGEQRKSAPPRLIGLLSLLVLLSQFRYDNGVWLAVGTTIYFSGLIFVLFSFYMDRFQDEGVDLVFKPRIKRVSLHGLIIGLVSVVLFWVMPRMPGHQFTMTPSQRGNRLSAFTKRLSLNDIGRLKKSKKHVLDIIPLDGSPLHSAHLKGSTFDKYFDGYWEHTLESEDVHRFSRSGIFRARRSNPETIMRYELSVKPMVGNRIFYFDHLVYLEGDFKALVMSRNQGGIYTDRMTPVKMNYIVHSSPQPLVSQKPLRNRNRLLQVPDGVDYLDQFLERVVGLNYPNVPQRELAQVIVDHFQQNYTYSLDINNQQASDPLSYFLDVTRSGHCELFASATVLLLRRSGVPSRLVTGFLVHERHPSGAFYHVTESSAHAWVEAHIDGRWVTIDPTPPAVFVNPTFFDQQFALLDRMWTKYILDWDGDRQRLLLKDLMVRLSETMARFSGTGSFADRETISALILLAVLVMIAFWVVTGPLRLSPELEYRRVHKLLSRHGYPKRAHQTWQTYVDRHPFDKATTHALLSFVTTYLQFKYAGHPQHTKMGQSLQKRRLILARALKRKEDS